MAWYDMVWHGMVWYGTVWYGMVWYGTIWHGMIWYGMDDMVWCRFVSCRMNLAWDRVWDSMARCSMVIVSYGYSTEEHSVAQHRSSDLLGLASVTAALDSAERLAQ